MPRLRDGRQRVEDALALRISDLVPRQRTAFGFAMSGSLTACDPATGAVTASITYEGEARGVWGRLRITQRMAGQRWADPAHIVTLSAREHPFGLRWWFCCPDGFGLVSTLYLPAAGADHFASRLAHGLAYASEGMTARRRAEARARQIRVDLGGLPDLASPFPKRPRGMHLRTFERQRATALGVGVVALAAS